MPKKTKKEEPTPIVEKAEPSKLPFKPAKSLPKFLVPLLSVIIIGLGTYIAIQYAKGYRPTLEGVTGTGLLAANSFPTGAQVLINDRLTTATDDTLNLPPGEYDVKIQKDGYIPWHKKLSIVAELVSQTNAELFRAVPSLSPLTLSGSEKIIPSPDGQKIAYVVTNAATNAKNGLYVLDLNNPTISVINRQARQVAKNINGYNFLDANLLWSPSSNQLLVHFADEEVFFLLDANSFNQIDDAPDVTLRVPIILSDWEEEIVDRETKQVALLPDEITQIATSSAVNVYFSPNEEKLMYTATMSARLADEIIPPLPATNSQPESRELEAGGVYIYDLKEDKNFKIAQLDPTTVVATTSATKQLLIDTSYLPQSNSRLATDSAEERDTSNVVYNRLQVTDDVDQTFNNFRVHYSSIFTNNLQWYPNSTHILVRQPDKIEILEYDNTNRATLYAGPFENEFVYPWPDGTKLIVLTSLNRETGHSNLYTIDVK